MVGGHVGSQQAAQDAGRKKVGKQAYERIEVSQGHDAKLRGKPRPVLLALRLTPHPAEAARTTPQRPVDTDCRHNGDMTEHRHDLPRLIKLSATPNGVPEQDHPKPERLIRGDPLRETWNLVSGHVPSGELFCGVWRCEPGHWRIAMGPTERELFTVLAGRCRVHDNVGHFEEAGAGEAIYIPPGFSGSFEVLETLTKTYMICE